MSRGCGDRVGGGVYAVTGLSPYGTPLEDYLLDPPRPVDMEALGISAIGVHLVDVMRDGRPEPVLLDWIGRAHYPNVADFIEELRAKGLSRRLPSTLDFASVTKDTRLVTIHERAWIETADELRVLLDRGHPAATCPRVRAWQHREYAAVGRALGTSAGIAAAMDGLPPKLTDHLNTEACLGLCWHDIEGGVPTIDGEGCAVGRQIGDVIYDGWSHGRLVENMSYQPAAFAAWPVSRIEVVADPATGVHEERAKRASAAGVPVEVVSQ